MLSVHSLVMSPLSLIVHAPVDPAGAIIFFLFSISLLCIFLGLKFLIRAKLLTNPGISLPRCGPTHSFPIFSIVFFFKQTCLYKLCPQAPDLRSSLAEMFSEQFCQVCHCNEIRIPHETQNLLSPPPSLKNSVFLFFTPVSMAVSPLY